MADEDWASYLSDHPILSLPKSVSGPAGKGPNALELSVNTLSSFCAVDPTDDAPTPSGRRQAMLIKDSDLIVAAGNEIRIASLGDSKLSRGGKAYKTLHTTNITFEIHSISLNPNGKLLAVVGAFQVAVVVMPRSGATRLVSSKIDCRSVQIGQYYHGAKTSPPIAKVEWHPWGEKGTTLLVMTEDGKLREYDVTEDTEEPQQVLSFVPDRRSKSFVAEDSSEREVTSFTIGTGNGDWGPLTIYALMKSGDIYAMSPYLPKNASVPSSYIHALDMFVQMKKAEISQKQGLTADNFLTAYDYQDQYVSALMKQLPSGTSFPAVSKNVSIHPPTIIKARPARQGPFLLQPSPRALDGSEENDATDILYLTFGDNRSEDNEEEAEVLGVVLLAYKDGKVDVCFDVEKVEAVWEHRHTTNSDLPMFAVYETIDLGLISTLKRVTSDNSDTPILELLEGNHPVLHRDPIQDETVYVYHAFGVHALQLGPLLRSLSSALRDESGNNDEQLRASLSRNTVVTPMLTTFSVERKCSNPVIAVAIPNDVYLTYSIFILTSAMRIACFPLRLESDPQPLEEPPEDLKSSLSKSKRALEGSKDPPPYVSLITEEYAPPAALTRMSGLPVNPRLALPRSQSPSAEFQVTPDTLRYLNDTVQKFMEQIKEVHAAHADAFVRMDMQREEIQRQNQTGKDMSNLVNELHDVRQQQTKDKIAKIREGQKALLARMEVILHQLMKTASPELSEHERKWFEELKRMKEDINGVGKYDEGSLESRTSLLQREIDRLLPSLKDLQEKEARIRRRMSENTLSLGIAQAFELGQRSNAERAKISKIENELVKLAEKLDLNLGRPPSQDQNEKPGDSIS